MAVFTDLESSYQASLSERRFWRFYLGRAVPIMLCAILVAIWFGASLWLLCGLVALISFVLVGWFFHYDMRKIIGVANLPHGFRAKLQAYARADAETRLTTLSTSLHQAHVETRSDLKLVIDYFEQQRPVTAKTSLLEWVLSIAITLASVVAIAYDDQLQAVDAAKLMAIFWPTLRIVLVLVIPTLVLGVLSSKIFFSRAKIDSIMIEDLAYLYLHFDQYQEDSHR